MDATVRRLGGRVESGTGTENNAYVQDVLYAGFASWRLLLVQEQKPVEQLSRRKNSHEKITIFRDALKPAVGQ